MIYVLNLTVWSDKTTRLKVVLICVDLLQ